MLAKNLLKKYLQSIAIEDQDIKITACGPMRNVPGVKSEIASDLNAHLSSEPSRWQRFQENYNETSGPLARMKHSCDQSRALDVSFFVSVVVAINESTFLFSRCNQLAIGI
jgi:hypothetical protein